MVKFITDPSGASQRENLSYGVNNLGPLCLLQCLFNTFTFLMSFRLISYQIVSKFPPPARYIHGEGPFCIRKLLGSSSKKRSPGSDLRTCRHRIVGRRIRFNCPPSTHIKIFWTYVHLSKSDYNVS